MKYILNSAVISTAGTYKYTYVGLSEAQSFLVRKGWESCIGYQETADALQKISGCAIPMSRKVITMQAGDEALVFRLLFRPDPAQKGAMGQEFILKNSEIGILRRIE